MQTAHEMLKTARDVISTPDKWTQLALARDSRGEVCAPFESRATCFCSLGALQVARGRNGFSAYDDAMISLYAASPNELVQNFNDDPKTTHADILAMFDRAIEATA